MADQKRWFKVWMSILTDPHFINLSTSQVGRWTRLGALMCQQGTDGKLTISPPSKTYQEWFDVASFNDLICALNVLPNVQIDPPENDNGTYTVIMRNWRKYQLDSTGYERLKRSRYKRREREDKEKSIYTPPQKEAQKGFQKPTEEELKNYADSIAFPLDAKQFLDYYSARGWQYKRGQPMKDWKAAVRTWKKNHNDKPKPEDGPTWMNQ